MDDPKSELIRDVRDVMRSLNRPEALRANRLVRALRFPGNDRQFSDALQSMIRSAVAPEPRLTQIVEYCDIQGLPHKAVAAKLGLSMRQLYRERGRAQALICDAIGTRLYLRVHHDFADLLADELESLHEASQDGRTELVLARTGTLLDAGMPDAATPKFLALRARASADSGDRPAAVEHLAIARRLAVDHPGVAAELEFAQACIERVDGRHASASAHARRAADSSAQRSDAGERGLRTHARHLSMLGQLLQEHHDVRGAIEAFAAARDALRSCRVPPQSQLLRAGTDLAATRLSIPDMADHATGEVLEVYRAAVWHGLSGEAEWARITLEFAALSGGNPGPVPPVPSATLSTAAGHWLARVRLLHARLFTAQGEPKAALASIAAARSALPTQHYLHAIADLRSAEALNALGDSIAALPLATGAIERLSFGSRSHYAGSAHVATADALHRLGNTRLAVEHCEAGVGQMRSGALVVDLSRALRLATKITGDGRYAREARGLLVG